jgi:hypothetical protein
LVTLQGDAMEQKDKSSLKLDQLSLEQLAALDLEGDQKHDVSEGPLLRIKPRLKLKTGVRAGGPIVGLART